MVARKKPARKKPARRPRAHVEKHHRSIETKLQEVESYEYLLVEYLKEISNEMTYLLLVIASLFLFIMIDFLPTTENFESLRLVFIVLIIGGFALFGLSNVTKRKIEKRFERMFY